MPAALPNLFVETFPYAPTDTPTFEVDVFKADGITAQNPVAASCAVTNLQSKAAVGGGPPTVTITGNQVVVVIPTGMVSAGRFRAALQIQIDAVPTMRTYYYDYTVAPVV